MLLSQPPSWWPTELVGFRALIFPHFNHRYITAKQLKTEKCFFLLPLFHLSSCYHRTDVTPSGTDGTILTMSWYFFDSKQARFYPGKGIQSFGMTKMVKWILTPNLVINTYDCLLHRLPIFCLSSLPKYPMPQVKSQAKVKRREDTNLRKQIANA